MIVHAGKLRQNNCAKKVIICFLFYTTADLLQKEAMEQADELLFFLNLVVVCYAAFIVTVDLTVKQRKKQRKRKRSIWIRDILRLRNEEGTHSILIPKLLSDDMHYRNF